MLPAAARMRRRGEFTATVRRGRRAGTGVLVVHLSRGDVRDEQAHPDEAAGPVVGFVIPKTVGGAVTRNAVRRRLRHLCRERLSTLPAHSRLVVRALPAAADASSRTLGRELDAALARALKERA